MTDDSAWAFGPFVLDRARRTVFKDGAAIRLGGRALDLLSLLIEEPGRVYTREELVARVWPKTIVEETSLRVHIAALRRALGDGKDGARFIANVPGRGYSFTEQVSRAASPQHLIATARDAYVLHHNLPSMPVQPIGRESACESLRSQLKSRRLVTLVGAGGMGKTTVAIATVSTCLEMFPDGVRFVDLSPLSDPALVASAVATTMGEAIPSTDPWPALMHLLNGRQMLIVLDNCEHVIDGAAQLAHVVLTSLPGIRILATSREPLNTAGEWVQRLPSLDCGESTQLDDVDITNDAPAIQLFVERASAQDDTFQLTAENYAYARQLCIQLDGIPLAIELAAARVDTLGVRGLCERLSEMFRILTGGRRTTAVRHQTLQALQDWSYALLPESDRAVLRRLALFRSSFSMEAAVNVCCDSSLSAALVSDGIFRLVTKSMVVSEVSAMDTSPDGTRFRLLHTTRVYAHERLAEAGELPAISRRHAEHLRVRMETLTNGLEESDHETLPDRLTACTHYLDDLRVAMDWAYSEQGDPRTAVTLASAAALVVNQPALLEEFRGRTLAALATISKLADPDPALEFKALAAASLLGGLTGSLSAAATALSRRPGTFDDSTGARRDLMKALYGMGCGNMGAGVYPAVLEVCGKVRSIASDPNDPAWVFLADRLSAQSQHYMGRHQEAQILAEKVLNAQTRKSQFPYVGHIPVNVSLRVLLARIRWITGFTSDGFDSMNEALTLARNEHDVALCHALAVGGIPLAIWMEDVDRASTLLEEFRRSCSRLSHVFWASWIEMFEKAISILRGQALTASFSTPAAVAGDIAATFSPALVSLATLERVERGDVLWNAPEVIRGSALTRMRAGLIASQEAYEAFTQALALARAQGAIAFELRASYSLAALCLQERREAEAATLLEAVLGRLRAGQILTPDAGRAADLLAKIRSDTSIIVE